MQKPYKVLSEKYSTLLYNSNNSEETSPSCIYVDEDFINQLFNAPDINTLIKLLKPIPHVWQTWGLQNAWIRSKEKSLHVFLADLALSKPDPFAFFWSLLWVTRDYIKHLTDPDEFKKTDPDYFRQRARSIKTVADAALKEWHEHYADYKKAQNVQQRATAATKGKWNFGGGIISETDDENEEDSEIYKQGTQSTGGNWDISGL